MSTRPRFSISLWITLTLFMVLAARVNGAPGDRRGAAAGASSHNVELLGRWASGPCRDVVVIAGTAYIVDGGWLEVLNVGLPTNVGVVGKISLPSMPRGLAVSDFRVYVADVGALRVIDVSVPSSPTEVGFYAVADNAWGVRASGDAVFVAGGMDGLRVFNVNDPTTPVETGFFETAHRSEAVAIVGDVAYVADHDDGLYIVDCTDAVPVMLQSMTVERCPVGVCVAWDVFDETNEREYRLYRGGPGEDRGRLVATVPAGGQNRYEFTDTDVSLQSACRYTLAVVGEAGAERILGWRDLEAQAPAALSLDQNQPNPFNPRTSIAFTLPAPEFVRLDVFDARGRLLRVLLEKPMKAGQHEASWDGTESGGRPAPSGIYFYRLVAGKKTLTRKMLLLK